MNTYSTKCRFTKKEKEYAYNLSCAVLAGMPDEIDYDIAKSFWPKILEVIGE